MDQTSLLVLVGAKPKERVSRSAATGIIVNFVIFSLVLAFLRRVSNRSAEPCRKRRGCRRSIGAVAAERGIISVGSSEVKLWEGIFETPVSVRPHLPDVHRGRTAGGCGSIRNPERPLSD
jgi:hypothetical protein